MAKYRIVQIAKNKFIIKQRICFIWFHVYVNEGEKYHHSADAAKLSLDQGIEELSFPKVVAEYDILPRKIESK